MERVIDVAKFIADEYQCLTKSPIDEMKLHKLLYFAQRECLAITNEPLFDSVFEGWKYGPVCVEVRNSFYCGDIVKPTQAISDEAAYIVRNVVTVYGEFASWKLSELSHRETSWLNARAGLKPDENGDVPLKLEDIRADAKRVRPFDSVWGMYYDEFDDAM